MLRRRAGARRATLAFDHALPLPSRERSRNNQCPTRLPWDQDRPNDETTANARHSNHPRHPRDRKPIPQTATNQDRPQPRVHREQRKAHTGVEGQERQQELHALVLAFALVYGPQPIEARISAEDINRHPCRSKSVRCPPCTCMAGYGKAAKDPGARTLGRDWGSFPKNNLPPTRPGAHARRVGRAQIFPNGSGQEPAL
jgi:hypothetical protein